MKTQGPFLQKTDTVIKPLSFWLTVALSFERYQVYPAAGRRHGYLISLTSRCSTAHHVRFQAVPRTNRTRTMTNSRTHSATSSRSVEFSKTQKTSLIRVSQRSEPCPSSHRYGHRVDSSAWKYLAFSVAILASRRNTRGNPCSRVQRRVDVAELSPGPDGNWNG